MDEQEEVKVVKVPVVKPAMSSTFLTALMAVNVMIGYVLVSTSMPWYVCGLVFIIALWQWRTYHLEVTRAELLTTASILIAVIGDQYDRLQALESKGTKQDETCLIGTHDETNEKK